jgi:hypothetical protein
MPEGTSAHRFSVVFTSSISGWLIEVRRYEYTIGTPQSNSARSHLDGKTMSK